MSNLQNTARLPLRTLMTNKWKSHTLTNDLLERKTQALEGSLNKPKLTMQRNQKNSTIETNRRAKEIPQYTRDKPAVKSSIIKQMIKCGQCEKDEAKMKCLECIEVYCANCFSQFHLRGALQRHRCVSLSTPRKKNRSSSSDTNLKESEELLNERPNLVSFQQSFLQWRDDHINKSKQIRQGRRLASPTNDKIEYSNKLPHIEFNSSKTTTDENSLSKKYRQTNKNNQETFIQRSKKTNITKKNQPKIGVLINIHHSFSENTNSNDSIIDMEPSNNDLSATEENLNNDHNLEQQERSITHVSIKSLSRPTSSSIKKDPITLVQQPLRLVLATKSTEELEAIIDSQLILSRSSSAISEKLDQPSNWIPSQSTSNNIGAQSVVIDQNAIAQFDLALDDLFDEAQIELTYQINSAKDQPSTQGFCINSTTTTPRRNSPFSFSNSLFRTSRINSSSSRDTGDGGFFTDVLPRQIIPSPLPPPPPPILECSTSNEWKHGLENQLAEQNQTISNLISLPKLSIRNVSRPSSKHSVTHEEIPDRSKSQIDNDSRTGSSLSSSSLPVSITSSKTDFDNSKMQSSATSSRENSSSIIDNSSSSTSTLKRSSPSTTKSSSSSTAKTSPTSTSKDSSVAATTTKTSSTPTLTTKISSSATTATKTSPTSSSTLTPKPTIENASFQPETLISMITEDKKVIVPSDADECLQESMNLLKDKNSDNANDLIKSNLTPCLTREENITENDLPDKKRTHRRRRRQTTTSDESSKFRKLEFSVGDGLKWQEASMESMSSTEMISSKQSSTVTTPRLLSPSSSINTKLAEQFRKYDNDDGRSSITYQNMNDEECFNQLHQELYSDLNMKSSDEDAILNEHILKILQGVQRPFNEKDLLMLNTKLRENETVHQPSIDNELLIHE